MSEAVSPAVTTKLDPKGLLSGVNPRLATVIRRAYELTPNFRVTCGLRTKEEQAAMVAKGASKTMNSRHLVGDAVDICVIGPDGKAIWALNAYAAVNKVVQMVSAELGERITWGGVWKMRDGPHFQIEHG